MEISTSQFKHCDVIKVTGRIDSATSPQLAEAINRINDQGRYKLVIDFTDVNFISSAGLRVLIATLKNCRRYNRGDLVLAGMQENIHSVFDLAGFTSIFKIHDDVLSAVGSF
ncbi:MAG TPA: STAS domain-containing protein [Anaerolineaceae bacterium]|nr:STAS domain-containing protein [Anaerolineaceae bacterium]